MAKMIQGRKEGDTQNESCEATKAKANDSEQFLF